MSRLTSCGILDTETDFQSEVDEFVKEGRDFFEILSMSCLKITKII